MAGSRPHALGVTQPASSGLSGFSVSLVASDPSDPCRRTPLTPATSPHTSMSHHSPHHGNQTLRSPRPVNCLPSRTTWHSLSQRNIQKHVLRESMTCRSHLHAQGQGCPTFTPLGISYSFTVLFIIWRLSSLFFYFSLVLASYLICH